jgi:hypothetical protein
MKKLFFVLTIAAVGAFSITNCSKKSDTPVDYTSAIVGSWAYAGSTADTMISGQWQQQEVGYDSSIGPNFADSLRFTATDTLYYTYNGVTTWSNYKVSGTNLILIGNGNMDTLTIHSITNNVLFVGEQTSTYYYWAGFAKYQ